MIDFASLPIVTANFDEYESKSAFCPSKGQATTQGGGERRRNEEKRGGLTEVAELS